MTHQKGDAILWLRHGEDSRPHRAILLMWFLPPPMAEGDATLLSKIAELFPELDTRQREVQDLEQAVQFGQLIQPLRHRLDSLTGGQTNHIDALDSAFRQRNEDRFNKALTVLRSNSREIADAFHRSKGYFKVPDIGIVTVKEIVNMALEDLKSRLPGLSVRDEVSDVLTVATDPVIAALVLYSLLENALDATELQPERVISIRALTKDRAVCAGRRQRSGSAGNVSKTIV